LYRESDVIDSEEYREGISVNWTMELHQKSNEDD